MNQFVENKLMRISGLFGAILLASAGMFLFGHVLVFAGTLPAKTLPSAPSSAVNCFTTYGANTTTQFASNDATAVQDAVNAAAVDDVVKVAGTCAGVQTISGLTQTVLIAKNLTLQGGYTTTNWTASPNLDTYPTILDAQGNGRVVMISDTHTVTLSHLTIQNGLVSGTENGGGVYNQSSTVSILDSNITGNEASDGGGVFNDTGVLLLQNSTVSQNQANANGTSERDGGGGLYNKDGHVTIDNSQISANTSDENGGGIFNRYFITVTNSIINNNSSGYVAIPPTGVDTEAVEDILAPQNFSNAGGGVGSFGQWTYIQNSTIRDNSNVGQGGGGIGHTYGGQLFIIDSTVSGNSANGGSGGGLYFSQDVTIQNSTFSGNSAENGGGIYQWFGGINIRVEFSTIASNTASLNGNNLGNWGGILSNSILSGDGNNCTLGNGYLDGGFNIDSSSSCGLTTTTSMTHTNPMLLPLADNGGDTETHALDGMSPALNVIASGVNGCGTAFTTDQRGEVRPYATGKCDVGAYEAQRDYYFIFLPVILKQ